MWTRRKAFTLVELLVVIAIIGVLVGLLVPAVNVAREAARKTECLTNQRTLAQAMIMFEGDKGYFPGRINVVRANTGDEIQVSWMTRLLPYIEKGNVWDNVINAGPQDPYQPIYAVELDVATCASDPPTGQITARLSYVVNTGIYDYEFGSDPEQWNDLRANGVCHLIANSYSPAKVDAAYISKNDGQSSTLLISENVNAVSWVLLDEALHGMVWTLQDEWLPESSDLTSGRQYQINRGHERWLDEQLLQMVVGGSNLEQLVSIARPSSFHSGGVNAVFCDSHTKFLSDEISTHVYAQLLSTSKTEARYPGVSGPIPIQAMTTLSDGDY